MKVNIEDIGGEVVKQDERYMRPAEVAVLRGDSSKAKKELKWKNILNQKNTISYTC